ncbi:O-antigen ligase family protein [Paenibacillus sp. GCM10027627]|uniref:O-antigen ligase family protein n=1 Tax=unclassified Paenibacillus TaxID=185978 RepID=UPI00364377B5
MAAKQRATNKNIKGDSDIPLLSWIGAIGIALFLFIFPYDRAMFNGYEVGFERTINKGAIFAFLLLLAPAIYLIRKWRFNNHINILSIVVLIIPFIYWLASFGAVSAYYSKFMVIVYALLAALFIVGVYAARAQRTRIVIEASFMISGGIIVLFGLLNLFGQIYYRDALWLAHDGYRLTSVFQYSNTYAGYLIALFLAGVFYAVHSSKLKIRLIYAAMLVPVWISFMMTFSRGAIVVIPFVVIAVLPFLRLSKQIAFIIFAGGSVIVSMAILGKISSNAKEIATLVQPTEVKTSTPISMFSALPIQSWGLLLLAMALMSAFVWFYHAKLDSWIDGKLQKLNSRKWSFIFIPATVILFGGLVGGLLIGSSAVRSMLPQQLADRIANINFQQHSVLERLTFYKDGLNVAKDYPLLGVGGGGWQAIYEQYQNNPYESRQAHSFYIQVLVEVGWGGLLALLAIIAYVYFLYIRSHIRYPDRRGSHFVFFIFSLTLLAHSAIDFDMSYIYLAALLFISLGAMVAPFSDKLNIDRLEKSFSKPWQGKVYPALLVSISCFFLFSVIQNNRAVTSFYGAINMAKEQAPFQQIISQLDKAIVLSPDQTAFAATKVNWLLQSYEQTKDASSLTLALETIEDAETRDPYNRSLYVNKIKILKMDNQVEKLLPVVESALTRFPWDITFYEQAMLTYHDARTIAISTKDSDKEAQYEKRIIEISSEVQRRIDLLKTLPPEQAQGRDFAYTESMNTVLASLP